MMSHGRWKSEDGIKSFKFQIKLPKIILGGGFVCIVIRQGMNEEVK